LLIGNQILSIDFDKIREYIRYGTATETVFIEQMNDTKNNTFHAIIVEPKGNTTRFHIKLFGWLVFLVTFKDYLHHGLDSVYLEELKTRESFYARTQEEAKQGMWQLP